MNTKNFFKGLPAALLTTCLLLACSISAFAQQWRYADFLNVTSCQVSNKLYGVTNLNYPSTWPTNAPNQLFTNRFGTQIIVGSGPETNQNLLADVPLYALKDGSWPWSGSTNATAWGASSYQSVSLTVVGSSGGSAAVNFRFVPVCDGVWESTTAGDIWTVGVPVNGTTPVTIVTNVPIWKWPGCKALRLKDIDNVDTTAARAATVLAAHFNFYMPQ